MSCDWDVYCKTCDDAQGIPNANHREDLMWVLVKHAAAIAGLAALLDDDPWCTIELRFGEYQSIDPRWFAKHLGHELVAIDEYGREGTNGPKPL